jgi:hypothetical protein
MMRGIDVSALENVPGTLYEVISQDARLTVIAVKEKTQEDKPFVVKGYYYVLDGVVCEGRELYSWLQMKLQSAAFHIHSAYDSYTKYLLSKNHSS